MSLYLLNQVTVTSIFLSISFNCSVKEVPASRLATGSPNGPKWCEVGRGTGENGKNRNENKGRGKNMAFGSYDEWPGLMSGGQPVCALEARKACQAFIFHLAEDAI